MKKTLNIESIVKENIAPNTRVADGLLSLISDETREYVKHRAIQAEAVRVEQKHSTLLEKHLNLVRTVEAATAKPHKTESVIQ